MANNLTISETTAWTDTVHLIDTDEPVVGGVDGVSNAQATSLSSRTRWLKALMDAVIVAGSLTPDTGVTTQLRDAIIDLIATAINSLDLTPNNASDTVKGIVELATIAEALAGTDSTRAVTPAGLGALSALYGPPHGQCRLTLSGGNLLLLPYNGNKLIVDGQVRTIPAAGVSLAPTGLLAPAAVTNIVHAGTAVTITTSAAHGITVGDIIWINATPSGYSALVAACAVVTSVPSTTTFTFTNSSSQTFTASASGSCGRLLYVYAYMADTAIALEAVPVTHATDATTGIEIKSGDNSRSLVGMCRTIAGPAFADTQVQRFVLSYFNRRSLGLFVGTVSGTVAATTLTEITASGRAEILAWPEAVTGCGTFDVIATTNGWGGNCYLAIDFTYTSSSSYTVNVLNGYNTSGCSVITTIPAEGFHTFTGIGNTNSGQSLTVSLAINLVVRG